MASAETEDEQHSPDPANFATVTPLERAILQDMTDPLRPVPMADLDEPEPGEQEMGEQEMGDSQVVIATRARAMYRPWQIKLLDALRLMCGLTTLACRMIGVSTQTLARHRQQNPVFDADCQAIQDEALDRQEAALHVSGSIGDIRPVYQGGEHVGDYRVKSEKAALAILSAKRPGTWRPDGTAQVAIGITMPPAQAIADAMARLTNETAPNETAQVIEDKPVAESQ